jgi:hypothetical protein
MPPQVRSQAHDLEWLPDARVSRTLFCIGNWRRLRVGLRSKANDPLNKNLGAQPLCSRELRAIHSVGPYLIYLIYLSAAESAPQSRCALT